MIAQYLQVLLVEDNPGDARLIREMLAEASTSQPRQMPFELTHVTRLEGAIEKLSLTQFQAILLDLSLPDSDGLETVRQISRAAPNVPTIVTSGQSDEALAIQAVQVGAQDYLVKSYLNSHLLSRGIRYAIERVRAEHELRKWGRVFEHAGWGIVVADAEGKMLRLMNPAFTAMHGYMVEELVGKPILDLFAPECRELAADDIRAVHEKGHHTFESKHCRKDGTMFPVLMDATAVRDNLGRVEYRVVNVQDITERKQAEDQIQRQLEHLAALRAIDMAINSSLDLRVTLGVFLEQVTTQLHVDAARVLLLDPGLQTLGYASARGFRVNTSRATQKWFASYAGQAAWERRVIALPDLAPAATYDLPFPGEDFRAYYAVPVIAKGQVKGVLEIFHRAPLHPDAAWLNFMESLAGQAAIAIDNATLLDKLQHSNLELSVAYDATIEGWSRALDLRDRGTEGHTRRVTEATVALARTMGIDAAALVHIRRGALLHDIGKLGVPDHILNKPGPLTEAEWKIMRQHPAEAFELLAPINSLRPALEIPYCHHEKWDGSGYPRGLKGEQIPLAARIFALVDVWDALRSDRPYRTAWQDAQVRDYIHEQSEKHFDPRVVNKFEELLDGEEFSSAYSTPLG